MRLLLLPIAALAFAGSQSVPEPTPRPVVILVHGRGHVDADSAELRREWKRDLDTALASVGLPRLADEDVRLVWYADALDPSFNAPCAKDADGDSLGLESLVRDFIGALADAMPKNEAPEARGLLADVLYVMDESTRCAAERRVGAVVERALGEKRPVIVVAYSLGSVVTYGYLSARAAREPHPADVQLITLGSPLGNREMRTLLGGSERLTIPSGVSSWENVYDPNDAFAAPLEARTSTRAVRDRITESGADSYGAHQVRRYLRDRETGAAVGRALCVHTSDALGEACQRLTRPHPAR